MDPHFCRRFQHNAQRQTRVCCLQQANDKEEEEAVIMNQRPEYERKLCNLRTLFEDQPLRYELGLQGVAAAGPSCGISPRSMTVKNASIDLDDD